MVEAKVAVRHDKLYPEGAARRIAAFKAGARAMRAAGLPEVNVTEERVEKEEFPWADPRGIKLEAKSYSDMSGLDRIASEIIRRVGSRPIPAVTSEHDIRVLLAARTAAREEKSGELAEREREREREREERAATEARRERKDRDHFHIRKYEDVGTM